MGLPLSTMSWIVPPLKGMVGGEEKMPPFFITNRPLCAKRDHCIAQVSSFIVLSQEYICFVSSAHMAYKRVSLCFVLARLSPLSIPLVLITTLVHPVLRLCIDLCLSVRRNER